MKQCGRCKQLKPLSEYHKKGINLQSYCKSCKSIYHKKYYKENAECYNEQVAQRKKRLKQINRNKINRFLQQHPCVDCGYSDIRALEFDHVRDKKSHNISEMVPYGYTWKSISKEMQKCEIRCANCHRIKTKKEQMSV